MICINVMITILLLIIKNDNNINKSDGVMRQSGIEEYKGKELAFSNSEELVSCIKNTNFKASKLMTYIQIYVQESLPKIYNDLIIIENTDLNKYLIENKEFLISSFGVNNISDLQKMREKLKNTNLNLNEFSKVTFIGDSGVSDKKNFSIKINILYESDSELEIYMNSDINYNVKFEII